MDFRDKKKSILSDNKDNKDKKDNKKQAGFVLLLFIVVVVIIATLWISTKHQKIISIFKTHAVESDFSDLKLVKERLLQFAMLQPEIYLTSTTGVIQTSAQLPAPGYFPCADLDGDGVLSGSETSCTNPLLSINPNTTGFIPDSGVYGFVPESISTRNTYFAEAGRYYYFLDERFSAQNPGYVNDGLLRYAPLNPINLEGDPAIAANSTDSFDPVLTLNGVGGYIVLIVDAGDDGLDAANADGDRFFVSGTNDLQEDSGADKIVGITYSDWFALVGARVCHERTRYQGLTYDNDDTDPFDEISDLNDIGTSVMHWYNDYVYTTAYAAGNNTGGSSWRSLEVTCDN